MCSPAGYTQAGFGPLVDLKTPEMRRMIHDAGLDCVSSHFTFPELKEHLDDRIAFAKELGLTQMICSSFCLRVGFGLDDLLQFLASGHREYVSLATGLL